MRIVSGLISVYLVCMVSAGHLQLSFKTNWCNIESNYNQELKDLLKYDNLRNLLLLDLNDDQIFISTSTQMQLEYINQLEQQESKYYQIGPECKYWVKRIKENKVIVYCEDKKLNEYKTTTDMNSEIITNEQITYNNLTDKDIMVIYAAPQTSIIEQALKKRKDKNYIIRLRFPKCYVHDPQQSPLLLSGIGLHFQIKHVHDVKELQGNLIWRTIWHKFGYNHANQLFWKENVVNHYSDVIYSHLMDAYNLTQSVDILQNHPNIDTGDFNKLLSNNSRQRLHSDIDKQQYAIVNYKYIPLDNWSVDPLHFERLFNDVHKNSRLIRQLTDMDDEVYSIILSTTNNKQYIDNKIAFMPDFTQQNKYFITLTDVTKDRRFEYFPKNFEYLQTDSYRMQMSFGSNFVQVMVFLNLNTNPYQDKILKALTKLYGNGVAMQIHVAITSDNVNDLLKIQELYSCLNDYSQVNQVQSIGVLREIMRGKKTVEELCQVTQDVKVHQTSINALFLCQHHQICAFPLVIINDKIIDYNDLIIALDNTKDSKQVENLMKDLIMQIVQQSITAANINDAIPPKEYLTFHYKNSYGKFTSNLTLTVSNYYSFLKSSPQLSYKVDYPTQDAWIQVTLIGYDNLGYKIYKWSQFITVLKNIHIVENMTAVQIDGVLKQGKKEYVFINGKYYAHIHSFEHYKAIIDYEIAVARSLSKDIIIKVSPAEYVTQLRYMRILDTNHNLSVSQQQLLELYFQNQTKIFTNYKSQEQKQQTLKIKAKLIVMSKESVVFMSYLHQSNQQYDIDIKWLLCHQLGEKYYDIPYHYYRYIQNTEQTPAMLSDLQFNIFPKIVIEIDSYKFNFAVHYISHFCDFMKSESEQKQIFGSGGTLDFDRQMLMNINETVNIQFEIKQINLIVQYYYAQSDFRLSKFIYTGKYKTDILTIFNRNTIIDQKLNIDTYYQIPVNTLGRYYLKLNEFQDIITVDIDNSIYQSSKHQILINSNKQQLDEEITNTYIREFTQMYNDYLTQFKQDHSIKFYFITTGALYETLLIQQLFQILDNNKYNEQFTCYIVENTYISPQFRLDIFKLKTVFAQTFNYHLIPFQWPYQLVYKPKQFRKQIVYFKALFTDQVIPVNVNDQIIFKDADQCMATYDIQWKQLANFNLQSKPLGLVVHGNQGVGATNVQERTNLFRLEGTDHYYCSAVILYDILQFKNENTGQAIRHYYNLLQELHNYIDFLPLTDQGLLNNLNRDIPIITALPDEWLWSEDFYTIQSKEKAKNIDMQSISATREKKLEQAFRVCPDYYSSFQKMIRIIR